MKKYALVADVIDYTTDGKPYIFPSIECVGSLKVCENNLRMQLQDLRVEYQSKPTVYGTYFVNATDKDGLKYTFVIQAI